MIMSFEEFSNLKPGDIVTVRLFEDILSDVRDNVLEGVPFFIAPSQDKPIPIFFNMFMRNNCGSELKVVESPRDGICLCSDGVGGTWEYTREMLEGSSPVVINKSLFDELLI